VKKVVLLDILAQKELDSFNREVRARFYDLFEILSKEGRLELPFAKKISRELFEIRIKHAGQWRATYAYIVRNQIIILSAFAKKTQKTPSKELTKAMKRLAHYQ
jgi:phage-related protein